MDDFNLPNDLFEFLITGQQIEYDSTSREPGRVVLNNYSELSIGTVWVDSTISPFESDDQNSNKEGYYEIPAVSLTKECEGYDPEYLLLWMPEDKMYGSWDCDHWDLIIFPNTKWDDILEDPVLYLNSMWDSSSYVKDYFKPFPKYKFKKGRPF